MKNLKNIICLCFVALIGFYSCVKEDLNPTFDQLDTKEIVTMDKSVAQHEFSNILSKAIYDNPAIRSFIKNEALLKFDNEYNVFYPYVKDKVVESNKTFRSILLEYCDEGTFLNIEKSLQLLNIHVPDLKLFGGFNAESWDPASNDIAVIYQGDKNLVFENGEVVGELSKQEIPGFPCLFIKESDRMKVSEIKTRAGEVAYEFVSEAFNPQSDITRSGYQHVSVEAAEDPIPYLKPQELDPLVVDAYYAFKNKISNPCHRDYIYYGITLEDQKGKLNSNLREELYKIRFGEGVASRLLSSNEVDDRGILKSSTVESRYYAAHEIAQHVWTGNVLDIKIEFVIAHRDGGTSIDSKVYSIPGKTLFSISTAEIYHVNKTWFRRSKNTYTIHPEYLKPKWVNLREYAKGTRQYINYVMDIYNNATNVAYNVSEMDSGASYSITESQTYSFSQTSSSEVSTTIGTGTTFKNGYSTTISNSQTYTYKKDFVDTNDDLGKGIFNYSDAVIVNDTYKNSKGYQMRVHSTGSFDMVIVPIRQSY